MLQTTQTSLRRDHRHRSMRIVPPAPLGLAFLAALSLDLCVVLPSPSFAAPAAPGDVYFSADIDERFKYYAFVNDFVQWEDETIAGTSLDYFASHDTVVVHGAVHISTEVQADGGLIEFDLNSEMTLAAQTGVFHETYNDLNLSLYVRGPQGTPFDITVAMTGLLQASRVGGLPGSLQQVNGTSIANFEDDELWISNGGIFETPIDHFEVISGTTTTEILVNGETYSLAFGRYFTTYGSITQALCILGCMQAPADFHSLAQAHVAINVYPGGATGVDDLPGGAPGTALPLILAAAPNPVRGGATAVTFAAPPGVRTKVDVFDVSGRRVAHLFDAAASGGEQSVSWDASRRPAGVYFVRVESGRDATTRKLTIVK